MTRERSRAGRRLVVGLAVVVLALVVAGAVTLVQRQVRYRALAQETDALATTVVSVIHPGVEPAANDLVLPSTLQAYVDAPIYARTNGYLRSWRFDIGSRVKRGDVLAELETPEIDQELAQAEASRQQMAATVALAKTSADRWAALRKSDSVSQQEVDEKESAYAQLQASLAAADANVKRLQQLEAFKRIQAPFSGVITRRNVDVGTLVNAGNGGAAQQLFHLAQTDPIRAYVSVPETDVPSIHAGLPASLVLTEFPGETFAGRVVRTAEAIDPATRTLLTEVDVPNPKGQLLPGGYAQVHLAVADTTPRLQVPVNSLLFREEGLRAVVVDAGHRAHLRALVIGRDFGTSLEVLSGLSAGDWIVLNPPDAIVENQVVRTEPAKAPPMIGAGG